MLKHNISILIHISQLSVYTFKRHDATAESLMYLSVSAFFNLLIALLIISLLPVYYVFSLCVAMWLYNLLRFILYSFGVLPSDP